MHGAGTAQTLAHGRVCWFSAPAVVLLLLLLLLPSRCTAASCYCCVLGDCVFAVRFCRWVNNWLVSSAMFFLPLSCGGLNDTGNVGCWREAGASTLLTLVALASGPDVHHTLSHA